MNNEKTSTYGGVVASVGKFQWRASPARSFITYSGASSFNEDTHAPIHKKLIAYHANIGGHDGTYFIGRASNAGIPGVGKLAPAARENQRHIGSCEQ